MTRAGTLITGGVLAVLAAVQPATAQIMTPKTPRNPIELSVGIVYLRPVSLGTTDADLLNANGNPFRLFRAEQSTGPGLGVEANIGGPMGTRVDVEFTGAWSQFDARSRITSDFEDAPDVTLADTITRFSVEGSVLWKFARGSRHAFFIRGGVGWMRELSSDSSLAEDGLLANAGVGLKYWLTTTAAGDGRFGLRAEFRALYRHNGIDFDDRSFRLWPAVAASAMMRF